MRTIQRKKSTSVNDKFKAKGIGLVSSYDIPELEGIFADRFIRLEDMARHFLIIGETGSGKTASAVMPIMRSVVKTADNALLLIDPKNNELRKCLQQQLGEHEYSSRVVDVDMEKFRGRFVDFFEGKRGPKYPLKQRLEAILNCSPSMQTKGQSSTNKEWHEFSKQFLFEMVQLDMDLRSCVNTSLWKILIDRKEMSSQKYYFDYMKEFIRGLKQNPRKLKSMAACIYDAIEKGNEAEEMRYNVALLNTFRHICKSPLPSGAPIPPGGKVSKAELSSNPASTACSDKNLNESPAIMKSLFPIFAIVHSVTGSLDDKELYRVFDEALRREKTKAEQIAAPREYQVFLNAELNTLRRSKGEDEFDSMVDENEDSSIQLALAILHRLNALQLSLCSQAKDTDSEDNTAAGFMEDEAHSNEDFFISKLLRWYEFLYIDKVEGQQFHRPESCNRATRSKADKEVSNHDLSVTDGLGLYCNASLYQRMHYYQECSQRVLSTVEDLESYCNGDLFRRVHDLSIGIEPLLSELSEPYLKERIWFDPIEPPADAISIKKDIILRKKILVHSPNLGWSCGTMLGKALKRLFFQFTYDTFASGERNYPVFYICDEFQRYITADEESGEQSFLDRCRAYQAVCVLSTQSMASLYYAVGAESRAMHSVAILLNNTGNKLFFRTTDPATHEWVRNVWPTPPKEGVPHVLSVRPLSGLSVGECYALASGDGRSVRHQVRLNLDNGCNILNDDGHVRSSEDAPTCKGKSSRRRHRAA